MPRYKLTIEYDGTHYAGWQKQLDYPTIQTTMEIAVKALCGEDCTVVGSGRTDAGVHASGQVAHVDLPKEYDPYAVMQGLNFHLLPHPIAVLAAERVDDTFHARFSATRRHYCYHIINRRARLGIMAGRALHVPEMLDVPLMQQAASILQGHHDFSSFRDAQCQSKSPVKTLEMLNVSRADDAVYITSYARSFLHHQMRIITGTLLKVGKHRWNVDDVVDALEAKDRKAAGPTAPADGLYLTKIDYLDPAL